MKKIAYFISSHGYGHAVRSTYLINKLGTDNEVYIFSGIPKQFFQEELKVPFFYINATYDVGCIQSDAVTIDYQKTVEQNLIQSKHNEEHLPTIVEWVKKENIELILSDVVPFAGVIAAHCGIPSVSIGNFWWDDIYTHFDNVQGKEWLVSYIRESMSHFTHHVVLNPPMKKWNQSERVLSGVNLIATSTNRRDELVDYMFLPKDKKIALIYSGNYGMDSVNWEKLEHFEDWHFIGIYPLPAEIKNFSQIVKGRISMQDITASVDVLISKLGYGTVTESLETGTPLLYLPRYGFAEYEVLEQFLLPFGHSIKVSDKKFKALEWNRELEELYKMGKRKIKLSSDTDTIAQWVLDI